MGASPPATVYPITSKSVTNPTFEQGPAFPAPQGKVLILFVWCCQSPGLGSFVHMISFSVTSHCRRSKSGSCHGASEERGRTSS